MKTFLVSYATDNFEAMRGELNASALKFGIEGVLPYSFSDLVNSSFYLSNRAILDKPTGAGYWLWKPYFILQAMQRLEEGDILFYADAGSRFIECPRPLVDLCLQQERGLVLFDARPLTNAQFTKRDCFVRLGCDRPEIWHARKVIATVLLARKCESAVHFLRQWLDFCRDPAIITDDPNVSGKPDLPEFLQHRRDQAVLSVLAAKYGIETFRNPTVWGNYLKMPRFRVRHEQIVSPYHLPPKVYWYAIRPQRNSPYGTILEINRQPNMVGKIPLPNEVYAKPTLWDLLSIPTTYGIFRRLIRKLAKTTRA